MNCIKCNSDRILSVNGKTCDCYSHQFKGKEFMGYVPDELGIGGGDYIEFNLCLECGQIQDTFPKNDPETDEEGEGHILTDDEIQAQEKEGFWFVKCSDNMVRLKGKI